MLVLLWLHHARSSRRAHHLVTAVSIPLCPLHSLAAALGLFRLTRFSFGCLPSLSSSPPLRSHVRTRVGTQLSLQSGSQHRWRERGVCDCHLLPCVSLACLLTRACSCCFLSPRLFVHCSRRHLPLSVCLCVSDTCPCSDPALKEFLVYLDKHPSGEPFIISELDDTHLFVNTSPGLAAWLQEQIDEWHDRNSYAANELEEATEASGGQPLQ